MGKVATAWMIRLRAVEAQTLAISSTHRHRVEQVCWGQPPWDSGRVMVIRPRSHNRLITFQS